MSMFTLSQYELTQISGASDHVEGPEAPEAPEAADRPEAAEGPEGTETADRP